MATQEKLHKSLEALRNLTKTNEQCPDVSKKKEKIHYSYIITEAISNPTIRISTNFHILLGNTIEAFLKLCDDPDSDVRMTSEECLNRIIRAANAGHIGKIQIELHKEIKRNGATRSLRTALWLFSMLACHIRPHKGKPYVVNMFPSLIKIAGRTEESIHETLAISLPKIMNVLGCFSSENEIKVLLKAFLANVSVQSAVIRRTTSSCILSICMNCRKPHIFLIYCLKHLLDLIIPVNESQANSLILGVMSCIKVLIPNLRINQEHSEDIVTPVDSTTEKLLQVYELCLHYLRHKDHNIINVCLETLNILLQNCMGDEKDILLNKNGIGVNRIYLTQPYPKSNPQSPSQLSGRTGIAPGEENLFSESELTETIHSDIEKWIDESKLSVMNITFAKVKEKSQSLDKVNTCGTVVDSSHETCSYGNINEMEDNNFISNLKTHSVGDLDGLAASENSSEKSLSCSGDDKTLNVECEIEEIDIGEFLDKDISLVYCTRLLTKLFLLSGTSQYCIPDKLVRVSVKSLALSCLSSIFLIYPSALLLYLDKNYSNSSKTSCKKICNQQVSDVLQYKNHSDPQLRGIVRVMAANFIKAISFLSREEYEQWISLEPPIPVLIKEFVKIFVEGLEDESSNCIRHTLMSLNTTLGYLAESEHSASIIPLLNILPLLSKNPYWLVKVALCEIISKIDYVAINYVTKNSDFQNKVLCNILFELLGDNDQRVRKAAANSIIQIIPYLYFEEYQIREGAATSKAILMRNDLFKSLSDTKEESNINKRHFIKNMPFPFSELLSEGCDRIDFSLSKIVNTLYNITLTATSKHLISGCVETLSLLSSAYPSTIYENAWCCNSIDNSTDNKNFITLDLLSLCMSLLNNSIHVYDLHCHINILNIMANLYAGQSLSVMKPVVDIEGKREMWSMFTNGAFCELSENYLAHVIKLLNIFYHILNEMVPIHPHSKAVLPSLPSTASNLSPIKRRKSDLDKKVLSAVKFEKEEKSEKKDVKLNTLGSFINSCHYLKIFDVLKGSFTNYKISLKSEVSKEFLELLRKSLHSLSVLMEIGTLNEFTRFAEEILNYLRSTFIVEAPATVESVQQLLKCLFGTNLTINIAAFPRKYKLDEIELKETHYGFYYNIFQKPYSDVSNFINSLNTINKYNCDGDSMVMGYFHRKDVKKRLLVLSKSSDKILANYIRIFEPMVIKSLKQYTITSDVKLQCKVLQLLNQLVQLRVNYCLLDSEQVFIGFVLKQFEYIEEGQVPFADELIPKIFQFLIQLSYSKQHSKYIISVPKIIQLCDGLMASGQPSLTHCIPALEPIVEDIFLTRNKSNTSDMKELETTQEVLLSMLLRLSEYKQVVKLITLILEDSKYCTDNTEKWLDWSKQVYNVFLPMLKQDKIRLDDCESFVTMSNLILVLNPNVFKPCDEIIIMLFQEPPVVEHSVVTFTRWLSKILILISIITSLKEEILVAKINKLKSEFSPNSIFENVTPKADPLNVNNNAETFDKIPAELIFIQFMFRVISLTSKRCLSINRNKRSDFCIQQFSMFLMHCLYMFQSGSHCKITNKAISIINKDIPYEKDVIQLEECNRNFLNLSVSHPLLTFYWCYFLTLINFNDQMYWAEVLSIKKSTPKSLKNPSINMEITKMGATISYSDYMSEDMIESEDIIWFLLNNSDFLVNISDEAPVFEFISSFHQNPNLSKLFIETVSTNFASIDCSVYNTRLLKCFENCHPSQVGLILNVLISNMIHFRPVALSRMAANLASRKIEFLLTLVMDDVINQLSKENIIQMQNSLRSLKLVKKHETLVSLLNKLSMQYYDLNPLEIDQKRVINPEYIKMLKINKKWYLAQVQGIYSEINTGRETAELLNLLEYNEIISFMTSSDFNKLYLQNCLRLGVQYMENQSKKDPAICTACVDCLLKDISSIANRIPTPHQVYEAVDRQPSDLEEKYNEDMRHLFRIDEFSHLLSNIASCIPIYINSLESHPSLKTSDTSSEDIAKFAVVCLEFMTFSLETAENDVNIDLVDILVSAADRIFEQSNVYSFLALQDNISWFCSCVNSIFKFVNVLLKNDKPLPTVPKYSLNSTLVNLETMPQGQATYQLYILVCWLFETKSTNVNIPNFFFKPIKSIIISLSRLPPVNSYILIPSRVWKTGWQPEIISDPLSTQVPPLPIEFLQEIDILEEYIARITLLGWTSRQQFEETWMCLLSVLCKPLDNLDHVEINDVVHSSSLAIKAITALLLQTLKYPTAGHPNISNFMHVSRDQPIYDESIGIKKLKKVQENIKNKYNECTHVCKHSEIVNVFDKRNFEKLDEKYSYGQMSIKYFLIATGIVEEVQINSLPADIFKKREKMLEEAGLDINSCLQFLLDYYTQLMKPQSFTHIRMLHEAIRSTVIISDLFTDKSQFSWMMDVFFELSKLHAVEDELLHQYFIVGICKAVGVLTPDLETYEQVKKLLVQYLKSPYLSSRIASVHGLLYILEGCKLSNITIGGISDEMQLILPCAVEYVQFNLNSANSVLRKSQEHSLLVWSLAFYLIENVDEVNMEQNFVYNTLTTAFTTLNVTLTNPLHHAIVKGLERLLIVKKTLIMEKFGKHILKLALEKMKSESPTVAILGCQLLLSYMYTDCADHLQNFEASTNVDTSPDHLVQTIEKISAIFERIKKGYVFEVDILCFIMPNILDDLFSPSDILTKVIGEFLSPQQPHQKLLSKVVFKVFESAIQQKQLSLLQDWVVFSLSNFTQSFSIGMATWCLTCFFISASSNEWLRSYFPYLQTRVGRYDYEDKKMLCIAGADFYKNLPTEKQKQKFVENFEKVKDQPEMPFNDLLSSL